MLHIKIGLYFGLNKNRDLKMSKYYIKFGISANPNAGSKAMKDIMALLDSKGYKAVLALPTRTNKIIKLIDIQFCCLPYVSVLVETEQFSILYQVIFNA